MKVLVTGASGLVGKLVVALGRARHDLRAATHRDLELTDRDSVFRAVAESSPEVVLHCAAYTDVDGAENEPEKAMAVNAEGAAFLAEAARERRAAVVYLSTDYVFDGEATSPYREEDEPRPLSSYGRSKLEGERRIARTLPGGHVIVRTGWVYGPGKGFVDWARARLLAGEEIPLITDQRGSPTSARELAGALWTLVEGGCRGLFHFVNSGEASWLEVGFAVAETLGIGEPRVRRIRAADLARPAPRPGYSVMAVARYEGATGRTVTPWRDALRRYLLEEGNSRAH